MEDLFELAENENIDVIEKNLPDTLKGFYYRNGEDKLICLEKILGSKSKRVVFAEELGHHFTSYDDTLNLNRLDFNAESKGEYPARRWAAEFLIPDSELEELVNFGEDLDLDDIADRYGVSRGFLKFRYEIWASKRGY